MKNNSTDERDVSVTSFCINCGEVCRYECRVDDDRVNKETCGTCTPLYAKIVEAEIVEDYADQEFLDALAAALLSNVQRSKRVSTRIEIEAARKSKKLAMKELRERRAEMHSKIAYFAKMQ